MTNVATTDCGAPANGSSRRRSALLILLSAIGLALCAAASPALAGGFERTGDLNVPRADPMVVKLADGKVLVAGGWTAGHAITQTAEIYDPATGTYTLTGSMARERRMGAAILLQSGKVLVVGGQNFVGAIAATAELFDPATGTFSDVSSPMSGDRVWPLVTLLNSGKVLVSHGCCGDGLGADLYDPASGATGTFTPTVGRPSQLFSHSTGAATKLADGKVLFAGDWNDDLSGQHAQIYDPGSDSFSDTTGLMTQARVTVMALRLASGKVLIAGGEGATGNTAETFDPTTGLFTAAGGTMSASRSGGYIAPLPDGKVLVAGGTDSWAGTPNNSADIFDPATGTFTPAGSMAVARRQLVVANPPVLSGGRVLFAGGSTSPEADPTWSSPTRISELYVPNTATLTVTNGNDSGSGSLRAALSGAANGDTINFDSSVTEVVLTSAQLSITTGVTISGPGADALTVKRSTAGGTPDFRVFSIVPGERNSATVSGLTVSNGKASPGGGISFTGDADTQLNLVRIAVVGNDAGWGGGLDLTGSQASSVLIDSSTVSGNITNGGVPSPGCCSNGAGMKIEVPTTIVNSTISGNASASNGGGIKVDSNVTILNSMIANNSAVSNGGGIWETRFLNNPNLVMKNTLVADNTFGAGGHECDVETNYTTLSVNLNNLVEDGSCNFLWAAGAVSGSATGFLSGDPGLSPLAYNGGTTKTQALAVGSIARAAGNASTCTASPVGGVDQRGVSRPSPCSIGAFDVTPTPSPVTPTPSPVTPTPDPVTPKPDPVTPKPSPSPLTPLAPSNTFTLSPSRVLGSSITSLIIVTGRGVTNQRGSFSGGAGARNSKTLTACRSSRKITKAGRYKLTCTLTSAARSARRRGPIRVTLTTTFTPTGGTARSATRKVTLKKASSGVTG